jgi:hypothetical protein
MRRFLARFSEPVRSVHAPSWADFITATPAFELSYTQLCSYSFGWSSISAQNSFMRKVYRAIVQAARVVGIRSVVLKNVWPPLLNFPVKET